MFLTGLRVVARSKGSTSSAGAAAPETPTGVSLLLQRLRAVAPVPLLRLHLGAALACAERWAPPGDVDLLTLAPGHRCAAAPSRACPAAASEGAPLRYCAVTAADLADPGVPPLPPAERAWAAFTLVCPAEASAHRGVAELVEAGQAALRACARAGHPVQIGDAEQWSDRGAHDALSVALAYLAAFNARHAGVRHYIARYRLDPTVNTAVVMDLARLLAQRELVESLHTRTFSTYREVCLGGFDAPPATPRMRGGMVAGAVWALALRPHLFCLEAGADEGMAVTCQTLRGVLDRCLVGLPDVESDLLVQRRKRQLVEEAWQIVESIAALGTTAAEPLADPDTLALATRAGLIDAPGLRDNPAVAGVACTRRISGAVYAVDPLTGRALSEAERIGALLPLWAAA